MIDICPVALAGPLLLGASSNQVITDKPLCDAAPAPARRGGVARP